MLAENWSALTTWSVTRELMRAQPDQHHAFNALAMPWLHRTNA